MWKLCWTIQGTRNNYPEWVWSAQIMVIRIFTVTGLVVSHWSYVTGFIKWTSYVLWSYSSTTECHFWCWHRITMFVTLVTLYVGCMCGFGLRSLADRHRVTELDIVFFIMKSTCEYKGVLSFCLLPCSSPRLPAFPCSFKWVPFVITLLRGLIASRATEVFQSAMWQVMY